MKVWKKTPIEGYICFVLLSLITIVMGMEIVARYIFNDSFRIASELSRYLFIWFIFISSSYAIVEKTHIRIEAFILVWPKKIRPHLKFLGNLLWFLFSLFIAFMGFQYSIGMLQDSTNLSSAMRIPVGVIYLSIPIGYALMAMRLLQTEYLAFKDIKSGS
ncbi:TRAP transporter small permease [Virgibacillus sediminis]|uniref:TRAP transporter small permease n=1 Tax=Virgibacillus sediminis TaxID=202260 RepID=A0ABV7A4R5_9BACI